jgi:hypothetical protein
VGRFNQRRSQKQIQTETIAAVVEYSVAGGFESDEEFSLRAGDRQQGRKTGPRQLSTRAHPG